MRLVMQLFHVKHQDSNYYLDSKTFTWLIYDLFAPLFTQE